MAPLLLNNADTLSEALDYNLIKSYGKDLFDFDHFKDCHEKLEEYFRTASKKPQSSSFGYWMFVDFHRVPIQLVFLAIIHFVPLIRKTKNYIKELPNADTFVTKDSGNHQTVTKNVVVTFVDTIFGLDYPHKLPENTQLIGVCLDPSALANTDPARKNDLEWISKWSNVVYISLGTISKPSKEYGINLLTSFQVARGSHQQRKSSDWFCIFKIPKFCYTPENYDALFDSELGWITAGYSAPTKCENLRFTLRRKLSQRGGLFWEANFGYTSMV
ncbi:hypothetical protein HK096_002755 [Nowakowskiella sp. JEL0078]|nr:hypothetical protein HK096_002755 [Nowakowskiella sp. JEL0078]